jgi:segregation and condensation protein B
MDELAKKVEAVLFAIGRFITLEELSKILRKEPEKLKAALTELKVEYENRDSSLLVITEAEMWKITTREEYSNIVRKIVSETELTKSQLETLAVIAFKYPIKQADLIRIRTNKAYDHLMDLEKAGFITRQRFGRSKLIRLTEKFFEYFDLPQDKLKERFKGFEQLAKTVEQKDTENKTLKEEQRKMAEEAKKQAEEERKIMDGEIEIDLQGSDGKKIPIEVVNEPKTEIEKAEEIEVVEEPQEKEEAKNEAGLN